MGEKNRYFVIAFFIVLVVIIFMIYSKLDMNNNISNNKNQINEYTENDNLKNNIDDEKQDAPEIQNDAIKENIDEKNCSQYLIASGYAGASNNAYCLKSNNLYHIKISTNEITLLAKGINKIENDIGTILVYKGKNIKIISEDNYLTYID